MHAGNLNYVDENWFVRMNEKSSLLVCANRRVHASIWSGLCTPFGQALEFATLLNNDSRNPPVLEAPWPLLLLTLLLKRRLPILLRY